MTNYCTTEMIENMYPAEELEDGESNIVTLGICICVRSDPN